MNELHIVLLLASWYVSEVAVTSQFRWVDRADRNGQPIDMDIFYDRVVLILCHDHHLKPGNILFEHRYTQGVFITRQHVLTSYNPYRHELTKYKYFTFLNDLRVRALHRRKRVTQAEVYYHYYDFPIDWFHQIIPMPNATSPSELWHGLQKQFSPLHDLMILKIKGGPVSFLNPTPGRYTFRQYGVGYRASYRVAGPMLTAIAFEEDVLDQPLMLTYLHREPKRQTHMRSKAFYEDENVIEDCEEYMPRYWGYFICIRNVDNSKRLRSGALLFYNNTLYGVSSFVLKKGNDSILVFTDVRPYSDLILDICKSPHFRPY
ncbi:uncharacterized protein LOC114349754 [Ostrinia furnacalis]|uniref:uncharacterized protein LOC114349754 n=1 Tax=Ostrinia furnacalis TaxID=93504 RepID=UPI00103C07FC|nr:uncharacterized protein LOC114349754 [Ostrinia furnacalis]